MAEQMALPDFNMLIEQVKKMGLHKVEKEQPVEDLPNKTIIVDKVDVTFKDVIVEVYMGIFFYFFALFLAFR